MAEELPRRRPANHSVRRTHSRRGQGPWEARRFRQCGQGRKVGQSRSAGSGQGCICSSRVVRRPGVLSVTRKTAERRRRSNKHGAC